MVPKKANQGPLQPRLAIFGDNSDSDNDGGADWVKKALKVCVINMKFNMFLETSIIVRQLKF